MENPKRGEIEAVLGGRAVRLCLTFGALASLEKRLNIENISELTARFSEGRFSTQDLLVVILAGLEACREPMTEAELRDLDLKENWAALLDAVARLLIATFGEEDARTPSPR
ncbi:MAG: gene transfer agent family protein [Alphaproteobacteria bacterium]